LTSEQVQAVAAIATFFAALVAVWATFRAPKVAAQFAEDLRRNGAVIEEQRRLKLLIFTNLLQYRAQISHENSVASLNLIDVVFIDSDEVRQAWKDFKMAAHTEPFNGVAVIERYHGIINCIARDLKLSGKISIGDIRDSYYPRGLGELAELAQLETQTKLSALRQPMMDQTSSTSRP
jgi:hypothetical protein